MTGDSMRTYLFLTLSMQQFYSDGFSYVLFQPSGDKFLSPDLRTNITVRYAGREAETNGDRTAPRFSVACPPPRLPWDLHGHRNRHRHTDGLVEFGYSHGGYSDADGGLGKEQHAGCGVGVAVSSEELKRTLEEKDPKIAAVDLATVRAMGTLDIVGHVTTETFAPGYRVGPFRM